MTWESVDLPEPFGPMMACTWPLLTVSESPWRISRSSTRTCRFLTSSNGIHSILASVSQLKTPFASEVLAYRSHLDAERLHPIGHLGHLGTNSAEVLQDQIVDLDHQPTLPSSDIEISFCASTANSIGSCCSTSLTKPLTTRPTASSWESPRWTQ